MFNLKSIQKTILFLSIAVFSISFILIIFYAIRSPNGFLATSLGTKPITAFTTSEVKRYSYGEKILLAEDVKIKDNTSTIVSKNLNATLDSNTTLNLDGLIYLKNTDALSITLSTKVSIELTPGEYVVSSNPIKVYVLSGVATYNQEKIASVNQTAIWLVDNFKTSTLNTDDFVLNKNYSDLLELLRGINLLPSQLSNLSLSLSDITNAIIQVNDTEDLDLTAGCESDLLVQHLLCDINRYRVENNVPKLSLDEDLNQLTLSHVVWMDDNQSTSTLESDGLSYLERCSNKGISCDAEINIKFADLNELNIYNQIIQNTNILNKDSAFVGINSSGNYLSILLR